MEAGAAGQESVYVVLDLQSGEKMPAPGAQLLLEGMGTTQPVLQLADGTRLVGSFEETVGSQLILSDAVQADGSHRVRLVGHTDKRITFTRPQPAAAAEKEAAEAAAGAAADAEMAEAEAAQAQEGGAGESSAAAAVAAGQGLASAPS